MTPTSSFKLRTAERNRLCHVNIIKPYYSPGKDGGGDPVSTTSDVVLPVSSVDMVSCPKEDRLVMRCATPPGVRLKNSELLSAGEKIMIGLPEAGTRTPTVL